MVVRKAREIEDIDTAAKGVRVAVADDVVRIGIDDDEEDEVVEVNVTDQPTPRPEPEPVVEEVEEDDLLPAPPAGEVLLKFSDSGPRSYNIGNLRFLRGEIKPVEEKYVPDLMETGYFTRSTVDAYRASQTQATNDAEDRMWPVGRFANKEAALRYAKTVHGIDLNPEISLRQINEQTQNLAGRLRARRMENEVEEVS